MTDGAPAPAPTKLKKWVALRALSCPARSRRDPVRVRLPDASFFEQRARVDDARHDVNVLKEQNDKLADEVNRLQTPGEIERMAREQFHMVYPGERAFIVTPAPATTTTVP